MAGKSWKKILHIQNSPVGFSKEGSSYFYWTLTPEFASVAEEEWLGFLEEKQHRIIGLSFLGAEAERKQREESQREVEELKRQLEAMKRSARLRSQEEEPEVVEGRRFRP